MTTIKIFDDKTGKHKGFEVSGHSGYKHAGEDIVCAAISMLVINTINSIETLTDDFFSYEENEDNGYIKLMLDTDSSHDTDLLISAMILGLSSLETNYKKNVRLITEEV